MHNRLLSITAISQGLGTTLNGPIHIPILDTDRHIPVGVYEILAPLGEATGRINSRGVASADQVRPLPWFTELQAVDRFSDGIEACKNWLDRLCRRTSFGSRSW